MQLKIDSSTSNAIDALTSLIRPVAPELTSETLIAAIRDYNPTSVTNKEPKRGLTRKEAAQRLSVSLPTIDRLCATGKLEKVTVGTRLVRITEESIEKLLQNTNTVTPTTTQEDCNE